MMRLPAERAEIEALVKSWGWTIAGALLFAVISWQGLTLYGEVQSWTFLGKEVEGFNASADRLLDDEPNVSEKPPAPKEKSADKKPADKKAVEKGPRSLEATFFYRPKSKYSLTAIFDDRAIVSAKFHGREVKAKEVKVGDRIEIATVKKIEPNVVTIQEDGSEEEKKIVMHKGLNQ
jgi:hypothetical protein